MGNSVYVPSQVRNHRVPPTAISHKTPVDYGKTKADKRRTRRKFNQ